VSAASIVPAGVGRPAGTPNLILAGRSTCGSFPDRLRCRATENVPNRRLRGIHCVLIAFDVPEVPDSATFVCKISGTIGSWEKTATIVSFSLYRTLQPEAAADADKVRSEGAMFAGGEVNDLQGTAALSAAFVRAYPFGLSSGNVSSVWTDAD